jgi:hypothetical protein
MPSHRRNMVCRPSDILRMLSDLVRATAASISRAYWWWDYASSSDGCPDPPGRGMNCVHRAEHLTTLWLFSTLRNDGGSSMPSKAGTALDLRCCSKSDA